MQSDDVCMISAGQHYGEQNIHVDLNKHNLVFNPDTVAIWPTIVYKCTLERIHAKRLIFCCEPNA